MRLKKNKNVYICPRIWCVRCEIPISPIDFVNQTSCPQCKGKVLKDKNFGHKINVIGETIGEHSEYLVFFETIKKEFENKGYKLLQTGMFGDTQTIKKYKKMNNAEKGYSTLNRYIIFQKVT